jgi:LuxR family transcriptional regulator, maltose regulon positive regulatory protein
MRADLVPRRRLVDRLREGRDRRLTLVCAPAGYGKTTLLGQWQAEDRQRTPFVWVSLDEGDADPVKLWHHIIFGLREIHPPAGGSSAEVWKVGPLGIATVTIPALINDLTDAPPLVLVLEDWHVLRSPACDATMTAFVEHAPETVQIVISSRSDPGLPLARLRAHGELAEVRAEQLRLSPVESHEYFRRSGLELESDDVLRLTSRTEGWAAGLQLAAIALREQRDIRTFIDAFSGDTRHILEFLARDVFDSVLPEMREFMLRTSIVDSLSAPLCDWLLETSGSGAMLAEIERANLFLVSLDDSRHVYRYHQLFARMLRRELGLVDPEAVPRLHARASMWYEREEDVESAVVHAIASRDVERASHLVTKYSREYFSSGRTATLARWLDALMWPEAAADSQLALTRATVLGLNGSPPDEIERWIEVASREPDRGPLVNGLRSVESGVALLRGLFLTKGLEVGRASAERAIQLEPADSAWRRQALAALGQTLYLLGRPSEAKLALEEARPLPDASGQAPSAALVLSYLAFLDLDEGRAAPALRLARDALALVEERHLVGGLAAANPELALGGAHMLGTDLHQAVAHLERAAEISGRQSPSYWHVHALLRLADALHRVGDTAAATEALESARFELSALPDRGMLEDLIATKEHLLLERHRREGFLGEPLSESELRVLRLLADGRSLREVAKVLFLSLNTVKTHRRTIYRKLGVTTRAEAVARAAELVAEGTGCESPG